ncbi:MAG: spondin domain-containing protein [Actinomycetota bacterium]
MRSTMRRLGTLLAISALALALIPTGAATAGGGSRYRVTIRVLTDGQPLTPPVVVTHRDALDLFEIGQIASVGIKEVAENGNAPALVSALEQSAGVGHVKAGAEPLVRAGLPGSTSFDDVVRLTIGAGSRVRFVSFASMLICTNDGFTGINHVRLPTDVGDTVRIGAAGYDAGTETNTEGFVDIVPPCQDLVGVSSGETGSGVSDPALFENGVIHHHPGIEGGADLLTDVHGWDIERPVAHVMITRIA